MEPSNRVFLRPSLLGLAFMAGAAAGCGDSRLPSRGGQGGAAFNVVLICLDTVRADHLTPYGHSRDTTPFLAELAERAVLFERASSTAGWTKPSVPSFLTGTYPNQHGVYEGSSKDSSGTYTDLVPEASLTLAEVFHERGYRTGAFLYNGQLRAGVGFEQGFDTYREASWTAEEIRWRGLDWLDEAEGDQPFFLYLHFLDAHWPYPIPAEYAARYAPPETVAPFHGSDSRGLLDEFNSGARVMTPAEKAGIEALYDGALAYLDDQLAHLWRGLEIRGVAANTIVCVIADHGEEFGEHGRVGHGHGLWEGLLHVPWILSVPGRPAGRVHAEVSLVDLFPTLLSAAGIPPPDGLEGVDRLARPDEKRPIFAEHKAPDRYEQSLRVDDMKFQREFTAPDSNSEILYPVLPGQRWEAEFDWQEDLALVTQLKPRDEAPEEATEIKGVVRAVTEGGFTLARFPIRFDPTTTRSYDDETAGPQLEEGLIVKVRGPVVDGIMQAERIKFYPRDEADAREIRGTVSAIEQGGGRGTVVLGGYRLAITHETELKDAAPAFEKPPLSRDEIARLLDSGTSSASEMGLSVERRLYDLAADGGESMPRPLEEAKDLEALLDQLGLELGRRRVFGGQDKRILTPEALQSLKDIGYGGDE